MIKDYEEMQIYFIFLLMLLYSNTVFDVLAIITLLTVWST